MSTMFPTINENTRELLQEFEEELGIDLDYLEMLLQNYQINTGSFQTGSQKFSNLSDNNGAICSYFLCDK